MSVLPSNLCTSEPQNIAADVHVCRCCLATEIKLYDLDEKHLGDIYNEIVGNFILAKDNLPYTACEICIHLLRKFGTFRNTCRSAKETLLQMYLEKKLSTDNIKLTNKQDFTIKLEKTDTVLVTSIPSEEHVSYTPAPFKTEASSETEDVLYVDSQASDEETKVKKEHFTIDEEEKFDSDSDDDSNDSGNEPKFLDIKIEIKEPKKENSEVKKVAAKRKANYTVSEPKPKKAKAGKKANNRPTKVEEKVLGKKTVKVRVNEEAAKCELEKVSEPKPKKAKAGKKANNRPTKVEEKVLGQTVKVRVNEEAARCELEKETDSNRKSAILFYTYYGGGKKSSYSHVKRKMDFLDKFSKANNIDFKYLTKDEQMADFKEHINMCRHMPNICEVCGRGFSMEVAYKKHLVGHAPSSGEFDCDVCKLRFKSRRTRDKHVIDVHLKRFICRQCGHVTKDVHLAKKHFARHAGSNFTCDHCGKKFTLGPSLKRHLRTEHDEVTNKVARPCVLCFDVFRGLIDLKEHRNLVHPQAVTCGACKTLFNDHKSLDTHLENSAEKICPPGVSPCPMCGDNFPSEKMMGEHHEQLHQKLKCNKCDQTFLSRLGLWTHSREHNKSRPRPTQAVRTKPRAKRRRIAGPKDLICEVCGQGDFKTFNRFCDHKRLHTGEKPFVCTECGKAFRLHPVLQRHMLTHTDERRYKCSLCPKAFHQHAHRKAHMLTHTKERPFYTCTACPKKYTAQQTLKEHIDTAHRGLPARKRVKNPGSSEKQDLISCK